MRLVQYYSQIAVAYVSNEGLGRAIEDRHTTDSVFPHGTQCCHEGVVTVN
jgi:hypothetical protein